MNIKNVIRLARNDLVIFKSSKNYMYSNLAGTILILIYLIFVISSPFEAIGYIDENNLSILKNSLGCNEEKDTVQVILTSTIIPGLLLLMSTILPGFLALSSITTEKEQRSLESLFLLPVADKEILFSKILATATIAIVGTWLIYICCILYSLFFQSKEFASLLVDWKLLLEIIVLIPEMAILSSLGGIIISLNVSDTRTALSMSFIPGTILIALSFFLMLGFMSLSTSFLITSIIVLMMLIILAFAIALSSCKRERVILRY